MCYADSRAEAEDVAELVSVEYDELAPVVDMLSALEPGAPLVHDHWGDNVFLETRVDDDLRAIRERAAITVRRRIRTARQSMAPLEGRGVVAFYDRRLDQLTVYSAAQMPHINRAGLAGCLGIDQGRIRVIAPDVGGGFGYKGILLPEEVCVCWLALKLGRPVRWIEDRFEQLTAGRELPRTLLRHHRLCRRGRQPAGARLRSHGRLGRVFVISVLRVSRGGAGQFDPARALIAWRSMRATPGRSRPTRRPSSRIEVLRAPEFASRWSWCSTRSRAKRGKEPYEVRLANLVPSDAMPFVNITNKYFDSGDYPQCVRRAVAALDIPKWRERQRHPEPDGRRIGVGLAIFCEQAAHGTSVYFGWGIPMVPGHEQCTARLSPDGILELRIGAHSHGQGLETTLAQVANETLGDRSRERAIDSWRHRADALLDRHLGLALHGDVGRCGCAGVRGDRQARAPHCRQAAGSCGRGSRARRRRGTGRGNGSLHDARRSRARLVSRAAAATRRCRSRGTRDHDADTSRAKDTGTFSYACHACAVAVDTELGTVEILDYVVVEDGGRLINPMIVDGQVFGGAAQGIGTALYEEMPFDAQGQPLASTLADYLLPGATEVPSIRIDHMETPSPLSSFGQKGIGEGGAIAPPAAIANAVNDALKDLGVEMLESPITPRRLLSGAGGCAADESTALRLREAEDARSGARAAGAKREAQVLAGGQSLGPLLNFRMAQPDLLVDVRGLPELARRRGTMATLSILGACVTHAAIEDGRVPDPSRGLLAARRARHRLSRRAQSRHARRQPRARRSCGRLGQRHGAARRDAVGTWSVRSSDDLPAASFVTGPLTTQLQRRRVDRRRAHTEALRRARTGYYKFNRKPGEFAEAIGAVLDDPERGDQPRGHRCDRRARRSSLSGCDRACCDPDECDP